MNRTLQLIFSSLLFLSICNASAGDSPTGKTLLQACQHMLDEQTDDTQTMLCHWYVTPCDCQFGNNHSIPRVCLPADADSNELARLIVEELQANQSLQTLSAEAVAANILAPLYPCD